MKDPKFIAAYDRCRPDAATEERVLQRLRAEKKRPRIGRRVLLAAACVALTAALTATGFAAYEKWRLPAPKTYESGNQGIRDVHETRVYEGELPQTEPSAQPDAALTDADFLYLAKNLLETVGLTDVDTERMTVSHLTALLYDREEVEVKFDNDRWNTEARFTAKDGQLVSFFSIDAAPQDTDAAAPTDLDAQELAKKYYEILPVPQGYAIIDCEIYDEQYYSYSFAREVTEGVYNPYELVRVSVNPVTGRLTGCNVFNFPLLDDHTAEDVPLTQAQAEQVAHACEAIDLDGYVLTEAKQEIVLPNWFFTDGYGADLRYSEVSRYAWVLNYEIPNSEFATGTTVCVDLYTGEILGGGMVG